MKKTILVLIFVANANCSALALSAVEMGFCTSDSAAVTLITSGGANYLGVTATLSDGRYYDFPVKKIGLMDQGNSYSFTLPGDYKAKSWETRLWDKKKKSRKPWSEKVVKHQGYIMETPMGGSVLCQP